MTIYTSSKGNEEIIEQMPYRRLVNALNVLERDQPHRTVEIQALRAQRDLMDREYAAGEAAYIASAGPEPIAFVDLTTAERNAWMQSAKSAD